MSDEQKIETTLSGLKKAFTKWYKDGREHAEDFMTDDQTDALTPEKGGEVSGEYFLGLLEGQDAPLQPNPR